MSRRLPGLAELDLAHAALVRASQALVDAHLALMPSLYRRTSARLAAEVADLACRVGARQRDLAARQCVKAELDGYAEARRQVPRLVRIPSACWTLARGAA